MENGFFILTRSFLKSELWIKASPALRSVIITLISKANHLEGKFNGITIPRGAFATTTRNLAKECRLSRRTLRDYLDFLTHAQFIAHNTAHTYTTITILYYNDLQNKEVDYSPTLPPNNPPKVGVYRPQRGRLQAPTWASTEPQTTITNNNKQLNIIDLIKETSKSLQSKEISTDQIKAYQKNFPWEDRAFLKDGLTKGGFNEAEIGKIFERVYPQQYTGKAV